MNIGLAATSDGFPHGYDAQRTGCINVIGSCSCAAVGAA
jgi:hypothetical protein